MKDFKDKSEGLSNLSVKPESDERELVISRRRLFEKYGAYTAPVVVSLLLPEQAYAMNGGTAYSSESTCQDAHTRRQAFNNHCMNSH